MNDDFKKINQDYTPEYCAALELAYGDGMMSEGGTPAIDQLLAGIDLTQKRGLDFGSGLGGAALYLAQTHATQLTGLEINPSMTEAACARIPETLQQRLNYLTYQDPTALPFSDQLFDVIYSKGVLVHVENKAPLFSELHRILKPAGTFVFNDWLSQSDEKWGPMISHMAAEEGLTLFPTSLATYQSQLKKAGFIVTAQKNESELYAQYNLDIVQRLQKTEVSKKFITQFSEDTLQLYLNSYMAISEAIRTKELTVMQFTTTT